MGGAWALALIEPPDQALAVFSAAFSTARSGGRRSVLPVLQHAAPALATIEQGRVLGQVYDRVMEVERWWGG